MYFAAFFELQRYRLQLLLQQTTVAVRACAVNEPGKSDGIADALIYQANQGVQVRGVFDAYQESAGLGGEYQRLREYGLNVLLDGHPEKMHHKVIIIDGEIVVTGSYNLTRSAEIKNDENTLIIHDAGIARVYLGEFEWIFADGKIR